MYKEFLPAPHLRPYVECYWHREDRAAIASHAVWPDGCSDILFTHAGLSFVGLMTTARAFEIPAGTRFFGIRFRPAMASTFLGERAAVVDCTLALSDQRPERRLFEQLAEARSVEEMAKRADAYLGTPQSEPNAMLAALSREPIGRVTELESIASPRHLRRMCLAHAGVSTKHLMRILRFRRAVERINKRRAQVNWADFAAACGYFDQAHMIREFQEFAGMTPGRFLQSLQPSLAVESAHGHETREPDRLY